MIITTVCRLLTRAWLLSGILVPVALAHAAERTQAVILPTAHSSSAGAGAPSRLLVPVAGVLPAQLRDTFNEGRAGGRLHEALDIPAPRGTPVLAAADGRVVKLFVSQRGGLTIYQLGDGGAVVYYYAHLDRYAEGLTAGQCVTQGQVIGYVGDTGNAGAGNYHLHFALWRVSDPRRYWQGVAINPYPLLRAVP
jgi:murein DD-endopeptidase MepM/ murein hydrolase activator NlpD